MANIKFCYDNLIAASGVTITASSEATGFGAENIYNIHYDVPWRTTGDTAEWIKFDFGAAVNVTDFIIKYHNLTSGATLKIQANATDAWGTPSVDETLSITDNNIVKAWAAAQSYRWWRIYIDDGSNPDTYIELGYAFLGESFQPTRNYTQPSETEGIDPTETVFSGDSHPWIIAKTESIRYIWAFPSILQTEITDYKTLRDAVGMHTAFFAIEDPDNADTTCRFVLVTSPWRIRESSFKGECVIEARDW